MPFDLPTVRRATGLLALGLGLAATTLVSPLCLATDAKLPLATPAPQAPLQAAPLTADLRQAADPELQRALERTVASLGLQGEVQQGRLALSLVDITDASHPRLAMLNGDEMLYAASLPKIGILLGAFVEAERGRLPLDASRLKTMTEMIRVSSNTAANQVLSWVGPQRLLEILQSPAFGLYDAKRFGGLWVGKGYGGEGAFQRDPLHNLSHGATAYQVARFYYLLDNSKLVNPQLTALMKQVMSEPGIHHKFVKGLSQIAGLSLYRKSGTWRDSHADSVLVEGNGHKYIMVGLAHHASGGEWLAQLAPRLHTIVTTPTAQLAQANTTR